MTRHNKVTGLVVLGLALSAGVGWYVTHPEAAGRLKESVGNVVSRNAATDEASHANRQAKPPAVTAYRVSEQNFAEQVFVTGSLIAREEIVVAPELEGLKIVELLADEGDRVQAGQVLARLQEAALKYQLAQRQAALARSRASIEQAKSQIQEAKARQVKASASLERAKPLRRQKIIAESVIDQRRAAAISASAQAASAEEGLRVAEASKAEIEAQIRELEWRVSRTEIKAPVAGLISKRNARIGEIAIGANAFSADAPMFRLIAKNEIELLAEVPETEVAKIEIGQSATVSVTGVGEIKGKVRLVSPEINKTTRLGEVRIFLGDDERLKLGSFARASINSRTAHGLGVPLSAIAYGAGGSRVLVIENGRVREEEIETGLLADGMVEVKRGLAAGDVVVAKAATFLREGDEANAILSEAKLSEAAK